MDRFDPIWIGYVPVVTDPVLSPRRRKRVTVVPDGPVLVEGPVELVTGNGQTVSSDRFVVALCVCRRSRRYPFCDTSHRRRVRQGPEDVAGSGRA